MSTWSKKPAALFKKTFTRLDDEKSLKKTDKEEKLEVGFVDSLFEMYKLRCDIAKARAELLADSAMTTYHHKFATIIFGNHIDYRASWIETLIEPKRLELDRIKRGKVHSLLTNF